MNILRGTKRPFIAGEISDEQIGQLFGKTQQAIRGIRNRVGIKRNLGLKDFGDPMKRINVLEQELRLKTQALNQAQERNAITDGISARLEEILPTLDKYPRFIPKAKKGKQAKEEWIQLISDVQLGQKLGKNETGGLGEYNFSIFKQRIAFLLQSIKDVKTYHTNPPDVLRLFFLGDIIDGSTIFKGQRGRIDLSTIDQVTEAVEYFCQFIYELAKEFPEVKCYGIPGNHGRIGDKGEGAAGDNLDMLVYRWMKDRLALSGVKNVSFDISESWYQLVYVNGWVFLLEHGDSFKGWAGIPFYGAQRTKMNFQDLLQDFQLEFADPEMQMQHLDLKEKFHYICFGDKHIAADFKNIIMNGCWPGGSELSLKYMQAAGMPQQWLMSVDKEFGVVWKRPIYLDRPKSVHRKIKLYT